MPGPGGFLLADDATQNALDQFDNWEKEARARALAAANTAATAVNTAATAVGQTASNVGTAVNTAVQSTPETTTQVTQPVAQAIAPEAQSALDQFNAWEAQQRAQTLAQSQSQSQPQTTTASGTLPSAPAASAVDSGVSGGTGPSPLEQFDQWEQQARSNVLNGVSSAGQAVGGAVSGAGQTVGAAVDQGARALDRAVSTTGNQGTADSTSQFGDPQLTADEAYAACGPAAAVRFAQMFGRNPTLREATDLAAQVGWTSQNGMAGITSEKALMDKLGVATHIVGADWDAIAKEAQTGNPVTISTPGHYFFADGYDPTSGAFHVGRSGLDLRGGSEWMTPSQMQGRMGQLQGALFADNPSVPTNGGQGPVQSAQTAVNAATGGAIDSSSPEAFAKSFAPYAAYAATKLGIDPSWVTAMAASESNYGKAAGNELFGVKAVAGQPGTTMQTHEGEYGGTTQNATFAAYDSPLDAVNAWIDLLQRSYKNAVGAIDLPTFVHGLKSGGYFTAAEPEYLAIVQGIQNRLGGTTNAAIDAAGGLQSAGQQALAGAGSAAQSALNRTVAQGGQVASQAQDVLNAGRTQLQSLQDQGDQALKQLQTARDAAQKQLDDYLQQSQQRRDQVNAQIEQARANVQPLDLSGLQTAANNVIQSPLTQSAANIAGQAPSPLGGTLGQNLQDIQQAPENLGHFGQDIQAASTEAQRQQTEQSPFMPGVSTAEAITGRQLPEEIRAGISAATPPPGSQGPDVSGPLSAFLKSAGIIPASVTVNLPVLGATPLADILGQAANFAIPIGAEERFAGSAAQRAADRAAFQATHDATQFGWAAALGSSIPQVRDAARAAVSGAGRWARASVEDIMADLAKGPIGDFVKNEAGTLDTDKLREIATAVKQQVTRVYHGTSADFEQPAASAGDPEALFGPGYYTTTSPEVAGGVVAEGGEQVGPSWLSSSVKRQPGSVVSPGYAQARPDDFSALQADLQDVASQLAQPGLSDRRRSMLNQRQQDLQQQIAEYNPRSGPNVRAVELPDITNVPKVFDETTRSLQDTPNLHMLNIEAPLDQDTKNAVLDVLNSSNDYRDQMVARDVERYTSGPTATGQDLYDALANTNKQFANDTLKAAGFDGISYPGGQRVPMTDARGSPISHDVHVLFDTGVDKARNVIANRQGGAADPRLALQLGGAAAGVASQEATMSDEDKSHTGDRFARDVAAGVLGATAPGTALRLAQHGLGPNYNDLRGLRPPANPLPLPGMPLVNPPQTLAQNVSAFTKNNLLSGIKTHTTNIISQLVELARTPLVSAAGGNGDEAIAGLRAAGQALPDAFTNFAKTLSSGRTQMTEAQGTTPAKWFALRALGATDDFFRTLGWAMGAGSEGQRLIRENPGQPLSALLGANQKRLDDAGQKMANLSVFGEGKGPGQGLSELKNKLLAAPDLKHQAAGLLLDAGVPFAAVPGRIFNIGGKRMPVVGESLAAIKFAKAWRAGDEHAMQEATGEFLTQSVVSTAVIANVLNGNIRGPDDKEHPSGIRIGGQWFDYSNWGAWALPIAAPAAMYEALTKEGAKPNPDYVKSMYNAIGKTMANQFYAADLIKTLNQVGEGNLAGATGSLAGSYIDRYLPTGAALTQATAAFDPVLRDPSNQGWQQFLQREQARIPGLEGMLPSQPSMTTPEPQERRSAGFGELLGMQTRPVSDLDAETNRLQRLGYQIPGPTKAPTQVSLRGSTIPLNESEQRELTYQRAQAIDKAVGQLVNSAAYQNQTDNQKAKMLASKLRSAEPDMATLWQRMTPAGELNARVAEGKTVVGRTVGAGSR